MPCPEKELRSGAKLQTPFGLGSKGDGCRATPFGYVFTVGLVREASAPNHGVFGVGGEFIAYSQTLKSKMSFKMIHAP